MGSLMPTFTDAVNELLTVSRIHPPDLHAVFDACSAVNASTHSTPLAERNAALTELADIVMNEHPLVAGVVAVVCGAIIEQGANVDIPTAAILSKTAQVLPEARKYADVCATLGLQPEERETLQRLGPKLPSAVDCWQAIDFLYRAVVAVTSRSVAARRQITDAMRQDALALSSISTGGHWLNKMFQVLIDETLVVLHPEQQRGYKLQINGIADNFQLHTLLADTLIGDAQDGWLTGSKPDPHISAIMRGEAPNDAGSTAVGSFNLYNYTGLQPDGTVDGDIANNTHWVWGEGIPADILLFEGMRVILLGKPPYARSWNAQRMFDALKSEMVVLEKFDAATYQHWVDRIRAAIYQT
jgi:hypothetical protein